MLSKSNALKFSPIGEHNYSVFKQAGYISPLYKSQLSARMAVTSRCRMNCSQHGPQAIILYSNIFDDDDDDDDDNDDSVCYKYTAGHLTNILTMATQ